MTPFLLLRQGHFVCLQLDSVVLMSMFAPSGVAKASIASWPLVGTCVSAFNVSQGTEFTLTAACAL
jgi:hypothetical protein